jgi:hypothetical protein
MYPPEQFQQKSAAVLRPELRENKGIEHIRDSKNEDAPDSNRWQPDGAAKCRHHNARQAFCNPMRATAAVAC